MRDASHVSEGSRGDGKVLVQVDCCHTKVRVGVDETRNHSFPFQIDEFSFFAGRHKRDGSVAKLDNFPLIDS